MSQDIQCKRRGGRAPDLFATWGVAAVLALLLAVLAEGLAAAAGFLMGDPNWHRHWVDERLGGALAWLQGVAPADLLVSLPSGLKHCLATAGPARDLAVWIGPAFLFSLVPARHIGPTLIARFDGEALRAPPAPDCGLRRGGPLGPHQAQAWGALNRWCFAGAGSGRAPWIHPRALPEVEQRFSVAVLTGATGAGKSHLAEAFSRHLDGADRLAAAGSRMARWRLRLRTKFDDCLWWRRREPADPWDCGYLAEDPAARRHLAQFMPRRATLLVADGLRPDSLRDCIEALHHRRSGFRHPVRLLVVVSGPPAAWGLGRDAWPTGLQDLGRVPVFDLSEPRFVRAPEGGSASASPSSAAPSGHAVKASC